MGQPARKIDCCPPLTIVGRQTDLDIYINLKMNVIQIPYAHNLTVIISQSYSKATCRKVWNIFLLILVIICFPFIFICNVYHNLTHFAFIAIHLFGVICVIFAIIYVHIYKTVLGSILFFVNMYQQTVINLP